MRQKIRLTRCGRDQCGVEAVVCRPSHSHWPRPVEIRAKVACPSEASYSQEGSKPAPRGPASGSRACLEGDNHAMSKTTRRATSPMRPRKSAAGSSAAHHPHREARRAGRKGRGTQGLKEFGTDEVKGVYGFTIRTGLGDRRVQPGSRSSRSATSAPTANRPRHRTRGHRAYRRRLRGARSRPGCRRAARNR